jgi:ribonuclease HI
VVSGGSYLGETTNNVAEYEAMIWGLENALREGAQRLTLYADSQLMLRQMNGEYRVKNQNLKPLWARARTLTDRIGDVEFRHVPREENQAADQLANQAMDELGDVGDAPPRELETGQGSLF